MDNTLSQLTQRLLKRNKISLDFEELDFQLTSHPSYPSLRSITSALSHFGVDNLALNVPRELEILEQLPQTFLAQIVKGTRKEFVVVSETEKNYELTYPDVNKETLGKNAFLERFTGVVLAVEKTDQTVETNLSKRILEWTVLGLASAAFIGLLVINQISILDGLFLLLALLGVGLSYSIKQEEIGEDTAIGKAFCSNDKETSDCNSIISSDGAKLFGFLKLSDISMLYFIGLSAVTSLLLLSSNAIILPWVISFFALPITLYSIYYQVYHKQWCMMCLGIVGIVWAQAIIAWVNLPYWAVPMSNFLLGVLSFFGASIILKYFQEFQFNLAESKKTKQEVLKFKQNLDLFKNQLEGSEPIETIIPDVPKITFGNKSSTLKLFLLTNPFCKYCKKTHKLISHILDKYGDQVEVEVRFNIDTENQQLTDITCQLLKLYFTEGEKATLSAMHEIYGTDDAEAWLKKWGNQRQPEHLEILENSYNWCVDKDLNFTPELLINQRSFPEIYETDDFLYFIEDLIEEGSPASK